MKQFSLSKEGKPVVHVMETDDLFTLTFTRHCTEELLYAVLKEVAPGIKTGVKNFNLAFEEGVPYKLQAYGLGVVNMLLVDQTQA